ncbi:hypothetical protein D3C84_666730 [compost metagenome]
MIDLLWGAHLHYAATLHHHDAVGHGQGLFLIVGHHDGGDAKALLQDADLAAKVGAHQGIQRAEGFVQQQQAGGEGERPGQRHPLLLAAGDLARVLVGLGIEIHQRQPVIDPLLDGIARQPLILKAEGDVLGHRQVGEEGVGLKHYAKVPLLGGQQGDLPSPLPDPAAVRQIQAGDGSEQGGLAAAGGAEKADKLPRLNGQRDPFEGLKSTELLVEMLNVQVGLGHGTTRY